MTWVHKLARLFDQQKVDPAHAIDRWNATAASTDRLVGSKLQAVQNVLRCIPSEVTTMLLDHTGRMPSNEAAFYEETFANKKLLPGFIFKTVGSPIWTSRGRVTTAVLSDAIQYCIRSHERKLPALRQKYTKAALEEVWQILALMHAVCEELKADTDIGALQEEWVEMLLGGDTRLEVELQTILHEKQNTLKPLDILSLKELLDKHRAPSANIEINLLEHKLANETCDIFRSEYDLFVQKAKSDLEAFRLYVKKSHDRDTHNYHETLKWNLSRQLAAKHNTTSYLFDGPHARMKLVATESIHSSHQAFTEFLNDVAKHAQLQKENLVAA